MPALPPDRRETPPAAPSPFPVRAWWDRMPPADHPLWKIAQGALAVAGLTILVWHGVGGEHAGLDAADGAGAIGLGVAGKLFYQFLRN